MTEAALSDDTEAALPAKERIPLSAWFGLAAMVAVAIYAIIDRQIFILLAEAIKKDMSLSDTQLGLLQGVGLALVGVITVYPISWLADRFDRRVVVAASIALWSLAVIACGFAPNFTWLMIGASLVGVGEAAIGPATYAMIPDLFPPSRRQLANSAFAVGIRFGGAAGVFLAGIIVSSGAAIRPWLPASVAAMHDWRLGFLVAAAFAPVAVLLMLALPRSAAGPCRAKAASAASDAPPIWPFLRENWRMQVGFFSAMGSGTLGLAGTAIFIPVIAARDFGQTPAQAGAWLGLLGIISGVLGFAGGMAVVRWLGPRFGAGFEMMMLAAVALGGSLASIPIAFAGSLEQLYGFWGLQVTVLALLAMVLPTVMQNMTPPPIRARLFAMISMFQLVAGGIAPVIVGAFSDALTGTVARPLLLAAATMAVIGCALGAFIFARLVRGYGALVVKIREEYE